MKSALTKIFAWLVIVLLSISALLMSGAYIFRDKAKALIIKAINDQVTEPVNVAGSVDFSLFAHFPYASVTFTEVNIKNKLNSGPKYLLKLREFSFLFNMWGLMGDKIQVSTVHADHGEINLYLDPQGNADYEIFKPSKGDKTGGGINIDLQKAIINDVKFTYLSGEKAEDINVDIRKLNLKGDFRSAQFDLYATGDLHVLRLRLNTEDYLTDKSINSDVTIHVDQNENKFTFDKAHVDIEKNEFAVKGYFISGKKNTYVDFDADTKGKDISKLIALIPARYKSTLAGTEGKGGYQVSAKIAGNVRDGISPNVTVTAQLNDAQIQLPRIRKPITQVSADGRYHMDSLGHDELTISHFHSEFNGHPQRFSLKLKHLSDPDFVLDADGVADLHELRTFFIDSLLQKAEGLITFTGFHMQGSKRDLRNAENGALAISGMFDLKDVMLEGNGITYSNINGSLAYADDELTAKGLTITLLNTDMAFDGTVTDLIAYVVSQNKRDNRSDLPLGIEGTVKVKKLNLSNIMKAYAPKEAKAAGTAKTKIDPRDVFNMKGHLALSVDEFVYDKMVFDNLKADLSLAPYRIDLNSITTDAMGGKLSNKGYVAFTQDREMILNFGIEIDKIDLPVLFRQCNNFGQTTLTDRHLKGQLSASAQIKTVWTDYKNIDMDRLSGKLTCSVLHGELINFDPIKSASKFIKVDELSHIVFSDLNNQLTIQNRMITIPMMEVQSSALNLMMSGTHSFDNIIDYQIKVNLRKVLAAKFGKRNNDVDYIEEDPYEGINLYLRMTGDITNPKIKYDRQSVKKKLKQDLAEQKEELQNIFKKDKTVKPKNEEETKREEKYFDTKKKPEFIDFQEEK
jgi:hypothetical protein